MSVKDRPILFSAPMVRALLEGRKTQTRRIVKHWEEEGDCDEMGRPALTGHVPKWPGPYGKPGDRLWVKETGWQPKTPTPHDLRNGADTWPEYAYDADGISEGEAESFKLWGWKRRPSIFMPRQFSRILLEITAVRVERLQDISVEEAEDEGCAAPIDLVMKLGCAASPSLYRELWESLNGAGSWDANPYVWVIEFKEVEKCRN